MKTGFLLFLLFGIVLSLPAQEIDPQLFQKTWLDKEIRTFNGYSITKEFGHYPHWPSAYNVIPISAVSYKGPDELKKELKAKAAEEKWPEKELSEAMRDLDFSARGGEIQVYISRYEEEDANFRWFFIILRGQEDKGKLWEQEIGYQAPEVPYERGWWNYTTVQIPIDLELPFYIYLNDKHSKYLSDFKFYIEKETNHASANE